MNSAVRKLTIAFLKKEIEECGENNEDNLRRTEPEDPIYFSCAQEHEINYLVSKLKKQHYDEIAILKAIKYCCCETNERKRDKFEKCVKKQLGYI